MREQPSAETVSQSELVRSAQPPPPGERRQEVRVHPDAITATVTINASTLLAAVLDISLSGIRLSLDRFVAPGAELTVSFSRTIAIGEVRNCRQEPDGTYQAGVKLHDVLNTT
jgi:hypothetical protein